MVMGDDIKFHYHNGSNNNNNNNNNDDIKYLIDKSSSSSTTTTTTTSTSTSLTKKNLKENQQQYNQQRISMVQTNDSCKIVNNNNNNNNMIDVDDINMQWFHGKITREEAETLLTPREDGLFLVRESTNFPGDYALCVCYNGRVEHYRVIYNDNKFTIDEEEYFDTLIELVEHYCLDADGLCTRLRDPVIVNNNNNNVNNKLVNNNNNNITSININDNNNNNNQENNNNNNQTTTTTTSLLLDPKAFEAAGWVIRMNDIKLGEILGKGEFGDVVLGSLYNGQKKVAVKKLKDSNSKLAYDFLTEASLMTSLRHKNLVQLLGVVFDGPTICFVTEYMAKGSLVDYLRSRGRLHVTKKDQIAFAADTCAGMAYLESKQVIHRDLAARNVLISEEGVAKVCDFGLARDQTIEGLEVGKFPIKWTAPEALRFSKFSNKSDMWSFGILLWEIYSFGRVPYPRIPLADVVKHVEKGYRMEAPEGCPNEIYDIMKQAWHFDPDCRPTFSIISQKLDQLRLLTI